MRVVVTGGAGFIGSHVVDLLRVDGHVPVVVDVLDPYAHATEPGWIHPDVELHRRNICEDAVWDDVLLGADAVCHLAAKVGLGVDFADAPAYVSSNDAGTATMLTAMHRMGWRGRIVLSSSMVVYGEGAYSCEAHGTVRPGPRSPADLDAGRFDPPCPRCGRALRPELVTESAPVDPRNVYAATKLHQEHLCATFGREHDVAVTALRYHNVYGPRMPRDTPYAGVASIFRSQLALGDAPQVFEDGGQRRDFVHVADVARANVLALTDPQGFDGPLNIASGHPVTLLEMAEALSAADGRGRRPQITGRYRLGDVRHVTADARRATDAIGFTAMVLPEDGLRRFADDPLRDAAPPP
ncbi:NAD-dependent epimerase/dehydratase family protein [Dermatobacter hominis]|uniref:NAD-dependent epimerase/dehydratase family protein n=1 Tax=Dermatobacter hominis TaxID=2884263 RepID=UPI001D10537C|nr:NAD-dependent epimerase/dehydratase family protein [Dermatobacter hominis]UDY34924.1 NAD-dependent epimerase/dehydratase family protein [Dermatobacter hominis]